MWMLIRCIIITFLQVLNAAETGPQTLTTSPAKDTSDHDDNGLKCLASNGLPCHFPFKWNGKVTLQLSKIFHQIQ